MKRERVFIVAIAIAVIFMVGMVLSAGYAIVAASPANDPRCQGQTGAAYGMCTAAIAVGCHLDATNPGCDKITENFTKITGQVPPPWLSSCPDPDPILCPVNFDPVTCSGCTYSNLCLATTAGFDAGDCQAFTP